MPLPLLKNGAIVTKSVRPKNLMNTISQKTMKAFNPILVTDVFEFIGVLISFWVKRSKVKVTAGNDPNPKNL